MSMFTKKPASQYKLEIKTYSIDAPKIVKTKRFSSFKKIIASTIISIFALTGISVASIAPAQADTTGWCVINANDNEWVGYMGGMWTSMLDPAKNGKTSTYKNDAKQYPTMRDRYGDSIHFLTWIPALRDNDPAPAEVDLAKGINSSAKWNASDGVNDGWNLSGSEKSQRGEEIRKGEATSKGFVDINCLAATSTKSLEDTWSNFIFQIAKGISNITTFLYVNASTGSNITDVISLNLDSVANSPDQVLVSESQTNPTWAYQFGQEVEKVLTGENGLYNSLYLDFLLPIILIGVVVVLLNAIRARAIRAVSGIVWMIVAIISGMLLLERPMMIPQIVDGLVGTITNEVNKAIIGDQTSIAGCDIPDDSANYPKQTERQAKEMECYIWYYTIYVPWAEGQFGVSDYDKALAGTKENSVFFYDPHSVLKDNGSITVGETSIQTSSKMGWPMYLLEYMEMPQGANVALAQNQAIKANIGASAGGESKIFGGGDKVGSAFLALAVTSTAGLFIGINSVLIIGYQIAMLLLLMVAPVFLLIGVVPSQLGKGIGLRWAEMVVGIAVKRMVIALMMALFLKMFIIVAGINGIGVGFQIVIFGVLAYLGITKRGEIMEMFTGAINFGGNKSISTSGVENVGKNMGKLAAGGLMVGAGKALSMTKRGVSAAAPSVKNAAVQSSVRRKTNKLSKMAPEDQAKAIAKMNAKNDKRQALDKAVGRGGMSGFTGGMSDSQIAASARTRTRSSRQAANALIADKFAKGELDLTPKAKKQRADRVKTDSVAGAVKGISNAKGTWNTIRTAPAFILDSSKEAASGAAKATRRKVQTTSNAIHDGVKNKVRTAKNVITVAKYAKQISPSTEGYKRPPKRPGS